ncbi:MAG: hypothetical protein AB1714_24835 [Acidobacteriota bacterium]
MDSQQLAAEANFSAIMNAILTYHRSYERYPASLQELVDVGLLQSIPEPPPDSGWVYYPDTGTVDFEPIAEVGEQAGPPPPTPGTSRAEVDGQDVDPRARADLEKLMAAIAAFKKQAGRNPASLDELVERGILTGLPAVPENAAYVYDPAAGTVEIKRR